MTVAVIPVPGLPMIQPGDDLATLIGDAIVAARVGLKPRDVICVCQKVVSKAENAIARLEDVQPSPLARQIVAQGSGEKDPRAVEVVLREAARIVRNERGHLIVQTRHGWVCANAGVDESNALAPGTVTLLPRDADASAAQLAAVLEARFGVPLAVIITDTFGRPWREGQVEVAIGCAGMEPLEDLRGQRDAGGRELHHTVIGIADHVASAAGLVMAKDAGIAVVVVRGVRFRPGAGGAAAALVRKPEVDLFR